MLDLRQLAKEREEATVDKVDLFDFYNKNWDSLIAEIARLREIDGVDQNLACDECWETIPNTPNGSVTNKHHKASCSLYDPDEE